MKQRQTMLLFGVSLPICVVLRIMQLIFTVDSTTGFVKPQYATIGVLITVIVCAATAAVSLLSATGETVARKGDSNIFVSVAAMLTAVAFFGKAITSVMSLGNGGFGKVFLFFLAAISAVVFVLFALRESFGKNMPSILLVVPVIYYIAELVSVFVSTSSLALVTENIFLIFSTCTLLLFVFGFASYENEIGKMEKMPKKLFATGLAAVMMSVLTAVPKLVLTVFGELQLTSSDVAAAILDIAISVFITAYVLYNFKDKFADKKITSKHSA